MTRCNATTPESIHTKDESKRDSAFAFIFGVNWLWCCGITALLGVFLEINKHQNLMRFRRLSHPGSNEKAPKSDATVKPPWDPLRRLVSSKSSHLESFLFNLCVTRLTLIKCCSNHARFCQLFFESLQGLFWQIANYFAQHLSENVV